MTVIDRTLAKLNRLQIKARFKIGQAVHPGVVRWHGLDLGLGPHMSWPCMVEIFRGRYEVGERAIVAKFLAPDDVVFEIGTGLGAIAMTCARRVGSDRVHTYEANPALEPRIRENFRRNRLEPELSICLLGEADGEADFFPGESFELSSAVVNATGTAPVRTPTRSLAAELRRVDPTFLIVDIEGGEFELFHRIDDFGRIAKVAVELHPNIIGAAKVEAVRDRLTTAGFVIDPKYTQGQQLFAVRHPR